MKTHTSYNEANPRQAKNRMPHLLDHNAAGVITPSQQFENHDTFFHVITSVLSTTMLLCIVPNDQFSELPYTITLDTHLADFKILTSEQIKHIQLVDPSQLSFMTQHEDTTEIYINELLKVSRQNPEPDTYWIPTPVEPGDHPRNIHTNPNSRN